MTPISPTANSAAPLESLDVRQSAKTVAQDLEAAFLTQMLTLAGVGQTPGTFGGGTGESQFSSFLVQEYAQAMSKSGGIGLAEHIFNAMVTSEGGPSNDK